MDHRTAPRQRLRLDRHRDHGPPRRHGRHQRSRPHRRTARRQRDTRTRTDRNTPVGLAEQQVVRYLLDTCATVDEAKTALLLAKHYYFFTPCHFVVADRSGASFVWEHSPRRNRETIIDADPQTNGRLVCTNHLLHRWPDPTLLPDDDGPIGTAALTYHRWRTLTSAIGDGAIVDRDDIRDHFSAVRFEAPLQGARTFWHALYDVDDSSLEASFYLHDVDNHSHYTKPLRLHLTR